jgi:hypothetical protein
MLVMDSAGTVVDDLLEPRPRKADMRVARRWRQRPWFWSPLLGSHIMFCSEFKQGSAMDIIVSNVEQLVEIVGGADRGHQIHGGCWKVW